MPHAKKDNAGGGIEITYNISERIQYWRDMYSQTGNRLFKNEARRLELEQIRNNKRLQKEAQEQQTKLFPDESNNNTE